MTPPQLPAGAAPHTAGSLPSRNSEMQSKRNPAYAELSVTSVTADHQWRARIVILTDAPNANILFALLNVMKSVSVRGCCGDA